MTEATTQALNGLRDFSTLKWYIIPLLAIVFYIYAKEIRKASVTHNWDPVLAALTIFGLDFFNESWNGWVLVFTGHSAVWTTPGETALRTLVGWNIEIMFMFLLAGYVYYYTLSETKDKRILGVNEKWLAAVGYSAICVLIECVLNKGGLLIWEYPFWNATFAGIWLIFLVGYFMFYVGTIIIISLKKMRNKLTMLAIIYAVPIAMSVVAGVLGWMY